MNSARVHRSSILVERNLNDTALQPENEEQKEEQQVDSPNQPPIQLPFDVIFRWKLLNSQNNNHDTLILENVQTKEIKASGDSQNSFQITYAKKSLAKKIEAFQAGGTNPIISNFQYFDSDLQGWRLIENDVTFFSNKLYREDIKQQKDSAVFSSPENQIIIDIKACLSNQSQANTDSHVNRRLAELESLVLSIGVQIVSHFTDDSRQNQSFTLENEGEEVKEGGSQCEKAEGDMDKNFEMSTDEERKNKDGDVLSKSQNSNQMLADDKLQIARVSSQKMKRKVSKYYGNKGLNRNQSKQFQEMIKQHNLLQNHFIKGNLAISKRFYSNYHQERLSEAEDQRLQIQNLQAKSKSTVDGKTPLPNLLKTKSSNNSTLDLAYIYADPLLIEVGTGSKRELVDFNKPLEIDKEFDNIVECLRKTKKKFSVTKKVATSDNLKSVIAARPQMIHISCHGDCIEKKLKNGKIVKTQYFLAFEEVERFCVLDMLTEERLSKLLGKYEEHGVKVVFVSACHSELIGQIFKKVGIPVVIAVNSLTPILDDVCRKFSRHFYEHLVQGSTPKQAFKAGKNAVQASKLEVYSCCCAHKHKDWCKWDKYFKQLNKNKQEFDKDEPHNLHMPNAVEQNCSCSYKSNFHQATCEFYTNFREKYIPSLNELEKLKLDIFDWEDYNSRTQQCKAKLCCCSPEIPHDETQKFMIVKRNFEKEKKEAQLHATQKEKKEGGVKAAGKSSEEDDSDEVEEILTDEKISQIKELDNHYLNQKLFSDRDDGTVEVLDDIDLKNQVKQTIEPDLLIGRNHIIKDIVQWVSESHRLMHVYGCGGMGKSDIVNFAVKYALYGRVELDGAVYVEIVNKETVNSLIQSICNRLHERFLMPKGEYQIEDIIRVINQQKYLIIIDNLRSLVAKNKHDFNKFIQELLDRTQKTKIIVISDNNQDISSCKTACSHSSIEKKQAIEIKDLTSFQGAQLMIKMAHQSIFLKGFKNEYELSKHQIFTKIPLKPTSIIQIAKLLMNQSLDAILQQIDQEMNQPQDSASETVGQEIKQASAGGEFEVKESRNIKSSLEEIKSGEEVVSREPSQNEIQDSIDAPVQNQVNEISLIMNLTFVQLLKEYPIEFYFQEYNILYIVCLMPSGLFSRDIDQICELGNFRADWKSFFSYISKEEKKEEVDEIPSPTQLQITPSRIQFQKVYHFLNKTFNQEMQQDLYVPIQVIKDFIISQLSTKPQFKDNNSISLILALLSSIARKILLAKQSDIKNSIKFKGVNPGIGEGIWRSEGNSQSLKQLDLGQIFNDEIIFQTYETNFSTFLHNKFLVSQKVNLTSDDKMTQDISQLAISVIANLIQRYSYGEAQLQIENCMILAQIYKLKPLEAKLMLLEITLTLQSKEFLSISFCEEITLFQNCTEFNV